MSYVETLWKIQGQLPVGLHKLEVRHDDSCALLLWHERPGEGPIPDCDCEPEFWLEGKQIHP